MQATFDWIPFYSELADKLVSYENNRMELLALLKRVYAEAGQKSPLFEKGVPMEDIDPFSVFACFNRGITDANRSAIIAALKKAFRVQAPVPTTFDGVPVVFNTTTFFFGWKADRKADDIDNLWAMFRSAIAYADQPTDTTRAAFVRWFDTVRVQRQVKWNLTMGLYWIRANAYLNLDNRNRTFLSNAVQNGLLTINVPKEVPSGEAYLQLAATCKQSFAEKESDVHSFPELSLHAWVDTTEESQATAQARFLRWFAPLLHALRELGGEATPQEACDQIIRDMRLGDDITKPIHDKTGVSQFRNDVAWARNYLAYEGYIDKSTRGVWRLTPKGQTAEMNEEIAAKITAKWVKINTQKRKEKQQEERVTHYWMYTPDNDPKRWQACLDKGEMVLGFDSLGDPSHYSTRKELTAKMETLYDDGRKPTNRSLAVWQFMREMEPGDIVYVKIGLSKLVGRGIITSDYRYDTSLPDYRNVREVRWTHQGDWDMPAKAKAGRKTLTDYTPYVDEIAVLEEVFSGEDEPSTTANEQSLEAYSQEDFLASVFMSEAQYDTLCGLLHYKKNVILQGPPGVGKTFAAKRLAYSMMGVMDINRVAMVQFHQSYSYEDFIVGLRPNDKGGFEISKGPFYTFCKTAQDDLDNDYFFIIDEINRGNLSKIFGELLMLIERDKREEKYRLKLLYAGETFYVPENVYIIGMMNTADRSLALMDYALRRRFAFYPMEPAFDSSGFALYMQEQGNPLLHNLVDCLQELNQDIAADESLGKGFCIGHSYLCLDDEAVTDERLSQVVSFELIPLLEEYWFDDPAKVSRWSDRLRSALQ